MANEHKSQSSSHTWQDAVDKQLHNECHTTASGLGSRQKYEASRLDSQNNPSSPPRQPPVVLNMDGAVDMDTAQPQGIIDWRANIPTPGPPHPGKTLRFRGMCLMLIGILYPGAKFRIHRLGHPKESDFKTKGSTLYKMRSAFDMEAIYRITMIECDACCNENEVFWSQDNAGLGFTADEYCNLLELGTDQLGALMMFSICRNGTHQWDLIRQTPGKVYTFQDCVDLLRVPEWCRGELQGFGNKTWTNGERPPELWICQNLSMGNVTNKIRNIMRQ